jgi:hypothetical protein
MELFFNRNPQLTKWLVDPALCMSRSSSSTWASKAARTRDGDFWAITSFPRLRRHQEVVDDLSRQNARLANKTFHLCHRRRGRRARVLFNPANPTNSSFYQARLLNNSPQVPVRTLDTLLAGGIIPQRGLSSKSMSRGSRSTCLGAQDCGRGVLEVECETSFRTSIVYPQAISA